MTQRQFHRSASGYRHFRRLNGRHPLRTAVPNGYVDYRARRRRGGRVVYFNFALAKEIGLIPQSHPHYLNPRLSKAILDAFALVIINEYDQLHGTRIPARDLLPGTYMATRYLQLQHPDRRGRTSGDGRSIWNGCFSGPEGTWDITSCGTGATRLSPASALQNRYFRTGDPRVSYGCGRAYLQDGISAAIMSEIFHRRGIPTERTLAVIGFRDGTSINVRAGRNLLRPAHFFHHLKQGNLTGLKQAVDCYIQRQITNRQWPSLRDDSDRYRYLLERVCHDFARAAAVFESEYIFCWIDWDGDNILVDGGIIDYGSIRQFGLYHHNYQYDDHDRMSTTIPEQRRKAKYIVQTFAQLVDFLITGKKRNIKQFASHSQLKRFDRLFNDTRDQYFARQLGFSSRQQALLLSDRQGRKLLRELRHTAHYFERAKSCLGPYQVSDGINWDAIFCLRDLLRVLPGQLYDNRYPVSPRRFIDILKSKYCTEDDLRLTHTRRVRIELFQSLYARVITRTATLCALSNRRLLESVITRSARINRYDRITGDAVIRVSEKLLQASKTLPPISLQQLICDFIDEQVHGPQNDGSCRSRVVGDRRRRARAAPCIRSINQIVARYRSGL